MLNEILRLKSVVILGIIIVLSILALNNLELEKEYASLVIYGDNIKTDYEPFEEDGIIYLSVDTISKTIDEYIYYDKTTSRVIITTENKLIKLKKDETFMEVNFEEVDILGSVKIDNDEAYVPIENLEDIYNIDVIYNSDKDVITVINNTETRGVITNNKIAVYSDIETDSEVLSYLNIDDEVIVYTENLDHSRWYKVQTDDNLVGYIFKESVLLKDDAKPLEENIDDMYDEKVLMYWQYGNNLETLTDEEYVNVVSPTLYEMSNSNGDITSKDASDYVDKAKSLGYDVWPIITNGIDDVNYTSSDTSKLMNSEKARENLIKNIVDIIEEDNLDGINIDFEAMNPDDKDMYSQFIRELSAVLDDMDKVLSVDVYFVNYVDREEIGKAVDYVMLMGYDQRGSWSSTAGSIAEVSWVEENVVSLMEDSNIPNYKIILGIPLYTRMFSRDESSDELIATVYSMYAALEYVKDNDLETKYDEEAGQNYIDYVSDEVIYSMWLEDETSLINRTNLVNEYELSGIAAWRKGLETDDTFEIIGDNFNW